MRQLYYIMMEISHEHEVGKFRVTVLSTSTEESAGEWQHTFSIFDDLSEADDKWVGAFRSAITGKGMRMLVSEAAGDTLELKQQERSIMLLIDNPIHPDEPLVVKCALVEVSGLPECICEKATSWRHRMSLVVVETGPDGWKLSIQDRKIDLAIRREVISMMLKKYPQSGAASGYGARESDLRQLRADLVDGPFWESLNGFGLYTSAGACQPTHSMGWFLQTTYSSHQFDFAWGGNYGAGNSPPSLGTAPESIATFAVSAARYTIVGQVKVYDHWHLYDVPYNAEKKAWVYTYPPKMISFLKRLTNLGLEFGVSVSSGYETPPRYVYRVLVR